MKLARLLVWLLLLAPLHAALADQVVPSGRVTSHLNVRLEPSSSSAVVGALRPGEAAAFERGVPFWYEVTLSNGTRGFVSKAWSRRVPDPGAGGELLRLGGWNVKKLGHGSGKDFVRVAEVIDEHFDIVAVVEVMQKGGAHPGYDALLAQLGAGWDGLVTSAPRPNTTSGNAEFYAVVYRAQRIDPCDGWTSLRYLPDNDGGAAGSGPDVFSREPAYGCFEVRAPQGAAGFDFMLAAYHARWADGDREEIQDEVEHVTDVFDAMGQALPAERDRILVGDFKLGTTDLEVALGPQVRTLGEGTTLNSLGARTANLYDHLLLFDRSATREMVGSPEVLDVREVAATPRAYFRTVSDHLPVRALFRAEGDDD
jgi:hypothetical protein